VIKAPDENKGYIRLITCNLKRRGYQVISAETGMWGVRRR
jgi:hypothetical protein